MEMLDITINNKTYQYINSIVLNDKNYIAYSDGVLTFISEYIINDSNINFSNIDDETFDLVKEALNL